MSGRVFKVVFGILFVAYVVLAYLSTHKLVEKRRELVTSQKQEDELRELAGVSLKQVHDALTQIHEYQGVIADYKHKLAECSSNQITMLNYIKEHKHE